MDILILHPGALGDIILSLPALAILRRKFPQAGITLAANLDYLPAVSSGYADRLLSLSSLPLHNLFGSDPVPAVDRQLWTSFDRILSWTGSGIPEFVHSIHSIHHQVLVVSWRPGPGETRHVSRIFADSIRAWVGEQREIPTATVSISPVDRANGREWLVDNGWNPGCPMIALHPGAGSIEKRWPLQNFRSLSARIMQSGSQLLVIEGPAEHGASREMTVGMPDASVIAAETLPLGTLSAVLSFCAAFVGNDSGIAHLAAAVSLPGLVLFGPTSPEQWAPIGGLVATMRNTAGCSACVSNRKAEHTCMTNLSVDSVWSRLGNAKCGEPKRKVFP